MGYKILGYIREKYPRNIKKKFTLRIEDKKLKTHPQKSGALSVILKESRLSQIYEILLLSILLFQGRKDATLSKIYKERGLSLFCVFVYNDSDNFIFSSSFDS